MADVFVSYARNTRDRVAELSGALEAGGYSLWWDKNLRPSDDYAMLIEEEIGQARCVVVAWSAAARQSLWVRAEANEALDSGKLVQISLDNAKLPLPFTMLHFLDFSRWSGERRGEPWSEFDSRVAGLLRGEGGEAAAMTIAQAPEPGPALQGLGRFAWLGWAAILLAALMAGAIVLAVAGTITAEMFGGVAMLGLALAAILLALAAFTLLRIGAASRR